MRADLMLTSFTNRWGDNLAGVKSGERNVT